jgi:hypothetical protein
MIRCLPRALESDQWLQSDQCLGCAYLMPSSSCLSVSGARRRPSTSYHRPSLRRAAERPAGSPPPVATRATRRVDKGEPHGAAPGADRHRRERTARLACSLASFAAPPWTAKSERSATRSVRTAHRSATRSSTASLRRRQSATRTALSASSVSSPHIAPTESLRAYAVNVLSASASPTTHAATRFATRTAASAVIASTTSNAIRASHASWAAVCPKAPDD